MIRPSSTERWARAAGVTRSDQLGACGLIPPHKRCAMAVSNVTPTSEENSHPCRNRNHGNEKM